MSWQTIIQPILLMIASGISAPLAYYAWRRRKTPGANSLVMMSLGVMIWTASAAAYLLVEDPSLRVYWVSIEYFGIAIVPPAWLIFSLHFSGFPVRFGGIPYFISITIGLVMALLVLTNDTHQLLWHDVLKNGQTTSVNYIGFWIFLCYDYILSISGIFLVMQRMLKSPVYYRQQCSVILLAGLIPLITNLLFESGFFPKTTFDPTPFGFLASAVLVWWGLFRFRILDLVPLAYTVLMENMTDGMIVINAQECIVEMNRAACSLLAGTSPCLIGRPVVEVLREWPKLHECSKSEKTIQNVVVIHDKSQASPALYLEVRVNPLLSQNGQHSGYLLLLQDVSERHRIEEEREALVGKLQTALGQVKTLSGLLPICAGCKKVRNKADQWLELDTYLMQHTEAQLTHGLCPNCVKIYFPD